VYEARWIGLLPTDPCIGPACFQIAGHGAVCCQPTRVFWTRAFNQELGIADYFVCDTVNAKTGVYTVRPIDDADDENAATGLFIGKVLKVVPSGKESTYEDKHDDDATIEVSELVCEEDRTDAKCLS